MATQELQDGQGRAADDRREITKPGNTPEAPATANDDHMGAKEDQVSPTSPPRPDDDEPKQG